MTTMNRKRTDIHAPGSAEFDPENYDFTGAVFDLRPEGFDDGNRVAREIRGVLLADGYTFSGVYGAGNCNHCGAWLRYAALLIHRPTRTLLYVGETCLGNRFESLTKGEFDRLRREAQLARERQAKLIAFNELCERFPALLWATYAVNIGVATTGSGERWADVHRKDWAVSTASDIARKARTYGDMSQRQADFLARLITELEGAEAATAQRVAKFEAEKATRVNQAIGEPGERRDFTGTVRLVRFYDNDYSGFTLLIIDTAEGTVKWNASGDHTDAYDRGDQVTIKATVKSHDIYQDEITTTVTRGKRL